MTTNEVSTLYTTLPHNLIKEKLHDLIEWSLERGGLLFLACNGRNMFFTSWGLSGGAMVLVKRPVPGRPTNLDYSRARAYFACSRCGWGLFGHFFSHLSLLFSFSLSLGDGPI